MYKGGSLRYQNRKKHQSPPQTCKIRAWAARTPPSARTPSWAHSLAAPGIDASEVAGEVVLGSRFALYGCEFHLGCPFSDPPLKMTNR